MFCNKVAQCHSLIPYSLLSNFKQAPTKPLHYANVKSACEIFMLQTMFVFINLSAVTITHVSKNQDTSMCSVNA